MSRAVLSLYFVVLFGIYLFVCITEPSYDKIVDSFEDRTFIIQYKLIIVSNWLQCLLTFAASVISVFSILKQYKFIYRL